METGVLQWFIGLCAVITSPNGCQCSPRQFLIPTVQALQLKPVQDQTKNRANTQSPKAQHLSNKVKAQDREDSGGDGFRRNKGFAGSGAGGI